MGGKGQRWHPSGKSFPARGGAPQRGVEHLGGKRGAWGGSVEFGSAASAKSPGLCVHGHREHDEGLAKDFAV